VTLADLEESPAYREDRDSHPQPPVSQSPISNLSAELSKLQGSLKDSDGEENMLVFSPLLTKLKGTIGLHSIHLSAHLYIALPYQVTDQV
jgi:hypothetical protein